MFSMFFFDHYFLYISVGKKLTKSSGLDGLVIFLEEIYTCGTYFLYNVNKPIKSLKMYYPRIRIIHIHSLTSQATEVFNAPRSTLRGTGIKLVTKCLINLLPSSPLLLLPVAVAGRGKYPLTSDFLFSSGNIFLRKRCCEWRTLTLFLTRIFKKMNKVRVFLTSTFR